MRRSPAAAARRQGARPGRRALRVAGAAAAAVVVLAAGAAPARAQEPAATASQLAVWADLLVRAGAVQAPRSWIEGGTGRLTAGGSGADERDGVAIGEVQAGLHWSAGERLAAHLHLRGRAQPDDRGEALGVVEAWAQAQLATRGDADRLRLRAGQLFLPTSRENVGPLWSSPYTTTLSALNGWIGEEVRPLGLLAEYETSVVDAQGWRLGGSLFWGNDTMGALLAWRGWALGDRLSVARETLPLPALPSLAPGGTFQRQDPDGTTPLANELDGRPGWAGWLRWRRSDLALVQYTHVDNRGDRALHGDEYAWQTAYDQLGVEVEPAVGWTVAGEALRGRTRMGVPVPKVDVDFRAAYLLASWQLDRWRLSARYDRFSTADRAYLAPGPRDDESGHAWTAALRLRAAAPLELTLELVDAQAQRPALAGAGVRQDGGRSATVGLRWRLGATP